MSTEPTEREQGLELAMSLVTASMDANFRTVDALYDSEREHRMALEVLIDRALEGFDDAYMGAVREYEDAVNILRFKSARGEFHGGNWIQTLSKMHPEHKERA